MNSKLNTLKDKSNNLPEKSLIESISIKNKLPNSSNEICVPESITKAKQHFNKYRILEEAWGRFSRKKRPSFFSFHFVRFE